MNIVQDTIITLKSDKLLCSHLAEEHKSIFHQVSPKSAKFPIIVYSVISEMPVFYADNRELQVQYTLRFHIITKDGAHSTIYNSLRRVMDSLGYTRGLTTEIYENDLKIKIVDYRIGVEA